jgi:hypothetical protein
MLEVLGRVVIDVGQRFESGSVTGYQANNDSQTTQLHGSIKQGLGLTSLQKGNDHGQRGRGYRGPDPQY